MFIKGNNFISKDIRSILLIQLGDIGDVVLSFPVIRALRENFPAAKLIVAVRSKAEELIVDCPWVDEVISINKEQRKWYQELVYQKDFFLRLWKFNFDLAIDLRTGTRGAALALFSGARQRIGFYAFDGKLWRNKLFTHLVAAQTDIHMAQCYMCLPVSFCLKTENIWPVMYVPLEKQKIADALLREKNIPLSKLIVAIQPFSLWQYKDWGTDKYIGLINRIRLEYDLPIILTGSADERHRTNEILKKCKEHVYNFAGTTSIGLLAAVLKRCGLFIGGDSAGVHIAAALGTPTVSIFGPSSPAGWAPKGSQHCIIQKSFECVPCLQKGCQGSGISRCLEELDADDVWTVVKGQIEEVLKNFKI